MPDLKSNELEALRKLKATLARDVRLVELRLFGSKARGDSDPESDIDVLIVLEELNREIRKQVSALCCDLSIDYHVVISPILYSLAEFTSGHTRITPFYRNVEREGVPDRRLGIGQGEGKEGNPMTSSAISTSALTSTWSYAPLFPRHLAHQLASAFDMRAESDYKDFGEPDPVRLREMLGQAGTFIGTVEELIPALEQREARPR